MPLDQTDELYGLRVVGLVPSWEEISDDEWTEQTPVRQVHHRVDEWGDYSPWVFAVSDGWQDYSEPPPEAEVTADESKAELERLREVSRIKRANAKRRQIARNEAWALERQQRRLEATQIELKREVTLHPRPKVSVVFTELTALAEEQWQLDVERWRGWTERPNKFAQLCLYCETVVPVGVGTYRVTNGGRWDCRHWTCHQSP